MWYCTELHCFTVILLIHSKRSAMRLLFYVISFLQVVHVTSFREETGYLGENVILHSGANQSWSLSRIEWSIFSNNTWIATYRKGRANTERVPRYQGRLHLNHFTGDLEIQNLTPQDAMEYTVDLLTSKGENKVEKIKLTVTQRLRKPTIRAVSSSYAEGRCLIVLECTSLDKDVHHTWDVEPPSLNATISVNDSHTYFFAFINNKQNVAEFTCNSKRRTATASQAVKLKCDAPKDKPTTQPPQRQSQQRDRNGIPWLFGGFIVGVLMTVLTVSYRDKILQILHTLKDHLCPSNATKDSIT